MCVGVSVSECEYEWGSAWSVVVYGWVSEWVSEWSSEARTPDGEVPLEDVVLQRGRVVAPRGVFLYLLHVRVNALHGGVLRVHWGDGERERVRVREWVSEWVSEWVYSLKRKYVVRKMTSGRRKKAVTTFNPCLSL